ncbi:MAG: hypothetical protein LBG99_08485 [Propionibacteriaceae bacterium]|nr:hypothetical protein [Propionibacteriaceae bacterium]
MGFQKTLSEFIECQSVIPHTAALRSTGFVAESRRYGLDPATARRMTSGTGVDL